MCGKTCSLMRTAQQRPPIWSVLPKLICPLYIRSAVFEELTAYWCELIQTTTVDFPCSVFLRGQETGPTSSINRQYKQYTYTERMDEDCEELARYTDFSDGSARLIQSCPTSPYLHSAGLRSPKNTLLTSTLIPFYNDLSVRHDNYFQRLRLAIQFELVSAQLFEQSSDITG